MGEVTEQPPTKESASTTSGGDHAWLLEYLRAHDAYCPLCKYNLRGLTQPRCPECGREIKLTVGLTEPHLRGLVTLLIALGIAAGGGVTTLPLLLDRGFPPPSEGAALLFVVYGALFSIIPAIACVAKARRIVRWPPLVQYALAGLAVLWDLALLFAFAGVIFRWFR